MDKPVLIDTSIWIEFFRKETRIYRQVALLMDAGRVCLAKLILAELLQGAKSEKEVTLLKDFKHVFRILEEGDDTWEKAALLSYRLKRLGKTVGLGDCFIATLAHENRVTIFTKDNDFQSIKTVLDLSFFNPA